MTALEQLPARMDRLEGQLAEVRDELRNGHVMIVTSLTEQIEASRRYARVLHEDVLDRIRVIGEGLVANNDRLAAHDGKFETLTGRIDTLGGKVDVINDRLTAHDGKFDTLTGQIDTLSDKIDLVQRENRALFEQVLSRLGPPKRKHT